jgi:hypothetical protein
VFRLRSVSNIVIAPARTGRDSNNSRAVMAIDHTNSGIRSGFTLLGFMLIVVVMKVTAPRMDDTPARPVMVLFTFTPALCPPSLVFKGYCVYFPHSSHTFI